VKGTKVKKSYWKYAGFFALGTFFGGWVLGLFSSIVKKA
jgi:hypothetical protein